jgi:FkbM family methyltransferase
MNLGNELGRVRDGLTFSGRLPGGHRLAMRFAASHYLGLGSGKDITTRTRGGSKMTHPVYALSALFEVFGANLYNLPGDFGDAPVVVDIGGHIGTFTVALCEAYPSARCFVFEPAPDTFSYLRRNIEQNGLSARVTAQEAAVAGHAGEASMDLGTPVASGHRHISFGAKGARTATVPVKAFAEVIESVGSAVDILKLDCEGSEYSIVEETSVADWSAVRRVVMEYHPEEPARLLALVTRMQGFGFRLVGQWRWKYSQDLLGMLWWAKPGYEKNFLPATVGKGSDHLAGSADPIRLAGPFTVAA